MNYNLLVVEDEPLVAAMIRASFGGSQYQITATAFSLDDAKKYLSNQVFDAAILDINLNGQFEGIEIGRLIRDEYKFPFIYLTAHADNQTLNSAKLTEPAGYVIKPFAKRELIAGLDIAIYNYKRQGIAKAEIPNYTLMKEKLNQKFSKREYEVLEKLFNGLSNKEIATELFISTNTIKSHLMKLFSKFDVKSRTELITKIRKMNIPDSSS